MVVLRLHRDGTFANARPCRKCVCMMKNLGIRRTYYSSGINSEIKCELVRDMISIQDSSSSKHFCRTQYNYPRDDVSYYKLIMNMHLPLIIKKESLENFINYYLKDWRNTLSFNLNYEFEKTGSDLYFRMFTNKQFTLFSMKVLL